MRLSILLGVVLAVALCPARGQKNHDPETTAPQQGPLSGRWVVTGDYLGTRLNLSLELTQQGDKLTGNFAGDKLEGACLLYTSDAADE